jgi:hypothetical protein
MCERSKTVLFHDDLDWRSATRNAFAAARAATYHR